MQVLRVTHEAIGEALEAGDHARWGEELASAIGVSLQKIPGRDAGGNGGGQERWMMPRMFAPRIDRM
jgi:hypothetical protein